MKNFDNKDEDENSNEDQKGMLGNHLPRNGDGRYAGRFNNGNSLYRIYKLEIWTGSADSIGFRKYRMQFKECIFHDLNYDLRRNTMTTAPVGLLAVIALIKNQPMDEDVKQILTDDAEQFWPDYKQGGRLRSSGGDE